MAGHYAGNERVSTPFGPGTVNGVANGNVVVYLDEGRMVELAERELTPLAEVIDVPAAVEDPFTEAKSKSA